MRSIAVLIIVISSSLQAEAFRVKCVHGSTSWGTAVAISKHEIITAGHVVNQGDIFVEVSGSWIKAEKKSHSRELDIALLEVKEDMEWHEILNVPELTLHASKGVKGEALEVKAQPVSLSTILVRGDVGNANSGAPVLMNAVIVAIVTGVTPPEKPERAVCVSAAELMSWLSSIDWKGPDVSKSTLPPKGGSL